MTSLRSLIMSSPNSNNIKTARLSRGSLPTPSYIQNTWATLPNERSIHSEHHRRSLGQTLGQPANRCPYRNKFAITGTALQAAKSKKSQGTIVYVDTSVVNATARHIGISSVLLPDHQYGQSMIHSRLIYCLR